MTPPSEGVGGFQVSTEWPIQRGREGAVAVVIAIGRAEVGRRNGAEEFNIEAVLRAIRHHAMDCC